MTKQICYGFEVSEFNDSTVGIVGRENYKQQQVARYACSVCGACALVRAQTLDNPDQHGNLAGELERAGFCEAAINVAPRNEDNVPVTSTPEA